MSSSVGWGVCQQSSTLVQGKGSNPLKVLKKEYKVIYQKYKSAKLGLVSYQWRIQTSALGCRKPMKTANLNLIQYTNFVLGKKTNKVMILFFAEVITLRKFVRTHMKPVVSRPAAEVTGYLPLVINYCNHRWTSIPSIKLNKP